LLTSISHTPPFVLNRSLTQFFVASNVTPLLAAVPLSQSTIFTNSVFCEPNDRVSRPPQEAGKSDFCFSKGFTGIEILMLAQRMLPR